MTFPEFVGYDDVRVGDVVLVFLRRSPDDLSFTELCLINYGVVGQDGKGRLVTDSGCYLKPSEADPRSRHLLRIACAPEIYEIGDRLVFVMRETGDRLEATVDKVHMVNGKPRYDLIHSAESGLPMVHPDDLERPLVASSPDAVTGAEDLASVRGILKGLPGYDPAKSTADNTRALIAGLKAGQAGDEFRKTIVEAGKKIAAQLDELLREFGGKR